MGKLKSKVLFFFFLILINTQKDDMIATSLAITTNSLSVVGVFHFCGWEKNDATCTYFSTKVETSVDILIYIFLTKKLK